MENQGTITCKKCGGDGMVPGRRPHSKAVCIDCDGSGFFIVKPLDDGKKCPRCNLRPCRCRQERELEQDEREHHDRY